MLTSSRSFRMSSVSLWCVLMRWALPLAMRDALSMRSGRSVPCARNTSSGFRCSSPITSLAIWETQDMCPQDSKLGTWPVVALNPGKPHAHMPSGDSELRSRRELGTPYEAQKVRPFLYSRKMEIALSTSTEGEGLHTPTKGRGWPKYTYRRCGVALSNTHRRKRAPCAHPKR